MFQHTIAEEWIYTYSQNMKTKQDLSNYFTLKKYFKLMDDTPAYKIL